MRPLVLIPLLATCAAMIDAPEPATACVGYEPLYRLQSVEDAADVLAYEDAGLILGVGFWNLEPRAEDFSVSVQRAGENVPGTLALRVVESDHAYLLWRPDAPVEPGTGYEAQLAINHPEPREVSFDFEVRPTPALPALAPPVINKSVLQLWNGLGGDVECCVPQLDDLGPCEDHPQFEKARELCAGTRVVDLATLSLHVGAPETFYFLHVARPGAPGQHSLLDVGGGGAHFEFGEVEPDEDLCVEIWFERLQDGAISETVLHCADRAKAVPSGWTGPHVHPCAGASPQHPAEEGARGGAGDPSRTPRGDTEPSEAASDAPDTPPDGCHGAAASPTAPLLVALGLIVVALRRRA